MMGTMEGSPRSGLSSPEAKLGMRVEDLWDIMEPQLSPTEKLNACFESIPVSAFPPAPSNQAIEIKSDASLDEAVQILAQHKILSAPVVDVDAPEDASWIDRYIGIVEFAGIVFWLLCQSEPPSPRSPSSATALAAATNGVNAEFEFLGPESAASTNGNFFEALTSSDFYKNTKVRDISRSFRWAPFLALQTSYSFLTILLLLLLSKYKKKSVPMVDLGEGKIENIITQSAVIHMLAECDGLQWFESWGTKRLSELGLPVMTPNRIIKVHEDEPVLQAFKLMRKKRIGGIPVIEKGSSRSITAKTFLTAVRSYLEKNHENCPLVTGMITCKRDHTMKELIQLLDSEKIHRIYVVDNDENLEGVLPLWSPVATLAISLMVCCHCPKTAGFNIRNNID
ncbi:SNF1-related protein kinase regulatory subunit gamma-1 isoform X3 [Quercus suber]|uniref:SNF1-related protein kinase regulatory subunit gamma-1 isoform X3 n=1 Tax=Quercus suber TaxID=58331 RepID=UPI0032E01321